MDILELSAADARDFFRDNKKIRKALDAMIEVGLSLSFMDRHIPADDGSAVTAAAIFACMHTSRRRKARR